MATPDMNDPWEALGMRILHNLATGGVEPAPQEMAGHGAPMAMSPERTPVGQAPQRVPDYSPGFSDRLYNFGRALQGAEVPSMERGGAAKNATYQALISKGIDPQIADAAVRNPMLMQQVLGQAFAPKLNKVGPGEALVNGTGQAVFRNEPRDVVVPADGTLFRDGRPLGTGQPKAQPGYEWIDPRDRSRGQQRIPGGSADVKFEEGRNKALTAMEAVEANLTNLENNIKDIAKHPGLGGNYGVQGVFPNWPGGNSANAKVKLDQLRAQGGFSTLQAMRDASKTGGALGNVSNAEGIRLENAFAALQGAQSVEQVKSELEKIATITKEIRERTRKAYERQYGTAAGVPEAKPDPLGIR